MSTAERLINFQTSTHTTVLCITLSIIGLAVLYAYLAYAERRSSK